MKKIALFALVSGSGLLALQEPVENESVAARPQQELPPGAQRHQPLQAESHTISANPGAGEVTTYEGPLEAGYEVETSSGHGVTVPKHSIGLFRGNYKPEPGISSSILNLAASEGKAFAFLMFEEGWEQAQVAQAELQRAGVIFRGELPGQAFQVEIPSKALAALQSTLGVRWVGELPLEHKIHPALLEEMEALAPGKSLRAYVGLMGDDWKDGNEVIVARRIAYTESGPDSGEGRPIFMPNGPFQAYLEGLGLEVTRYARNTRSFAVEGPARVILELARRNDVHFLDSNSRATGSHDESVAFVGQDYIRDTFDGFSTEVGIIDSEIMMYDSQGGDHDDLDIFCVGWDNTGLGVGQNAHGHGTHVAGTVLGRGIADNRMEGNAKGVGSSGTQRLFHGRYLDASNSGVGDPADLYDDLSDSYTDGSGNTTFRPKVINNSWGANGSWNGTEQRCIDVDEVVWDHQQTYVFAAGNDGSGSGRVGRPAVAKNVLTVANAETFESGEGNNDAGDLRDSSSRGPTGDNRLKPEITAPGCWINSTDAFDFSGYVEFNGTSMAAPHVTGALASFIDSYGSLVQYNPKLNRAWTAATALKKSGDRFADSEFGFGYMNSYRMQYSTSDWALSYLDNSTVNTSTTWVSTLITVPANCERLGIYLNWDEPPCSITAGSTPILADVELYLDYDDNQSGGNTGNVVADGNGNYQYMIINNPPEGTHKIKIWPVDTTISGLFADDLDVALTIMREYDDVRPEISLTSDFQDDTVQPGQTVTLESTASNSDYIATNVMYNLLSNPSGLDVTGRRVVLKDGEALAYDTNDLTEGWNGGPGGLNNSWQLESMMLGAINPNSSRTIELDLEAPASEGTYNVQVKVNNDNGPNSFGHSDYESSTLTVDGTEPGLVTNLTSSHAAGVWKNDPNVSYAWTAATDNLSGVDGYGLYTTSSSSPPGNIKDIEEVTSYAETLVEGSWYFNIKTVDNSSNWSSGFESYGPVQIDLTDPEVVTGLTSSTHVAGTTSNDPNITFDWVAAADLLSGIDGYGIWITGSPGMPGTTKDLEEVTTHSTSLADGTWYFNIRSVDNAGNWDGGYETWGPITIDTTPPGPTLALNNLVSGSIASAEFTHCSPNRTVFFFWSIIGGGPVGTSYGDLYVSPPYKTIRMRTDATGGATKLKPVPPGLSGVNVWAHGLDWFSGTLTNPLALTIG